MMFIAPILHYTTIPVNFSWIIYKIGIIYGLYIILIITYNDKALHAVIFNKFCRWKDFDEASGLTM